MGILEYEVHQHNHFPQSYSDLSLHYSYLNAASNNAYNIFPIQYVSNPVIINSDILFLSLLWLKKYRVQDFRIA